MKRTFYNIGIDPISQTNSIYAACVWRNGIPYKIFHNQRRFKLWLWWQRIKGCKMICISETKSPDKY